MGCWRSRRSIARFIAASYSDAGPKVYGPIVFRRSDQSAGGYECFLINRSVLRQRRWRAYELRPRYGRDVKAARSLSPCSASRECWLRLRYTSCRTTLELWDLAELFFFRSPPTLRLLAFSSRPVQQLVLHLLATFCKQAPHGAAQFWSSRAPVLKQNRRHSESCGEFGPTCARRSYSFRTSILFPKVFQGQQKWLLPLIVLQVFQGELGLLISLPENSDDLRGGEMLLDQLMRKGQRRVERAAKSPADSGIRPEEFRGILCRASDLALSPTG